MNENFNHKIISDEEARIIYQKYKKEGFKPVISESRESLGYKSLPKNATKEEILEDLENITQELIKAIEDGGDEFNEEDSFFIAPDISGGM
jgi:hypothetical protein